MFVSVLIFDYASLKHQSIKLLLLRNYAEIVFSICQKSANTRVHQRTQCSKMLSLYKFLLFVRRAGLVNFKMSCLFVLVTFVFLVFEHSVRENQKHFFCHLPLKSYREVFLFAQKSIFFRLGVGHFFTLKTKRETKKTFSLNKDSKKNVLFLDFQLES